jgi:trimeric autotransporter adhesin
MRKLYMMLVAVLCFAAGGFTQVAVTVDVPTNTTPALAASYTSLANAITALNTITAISGPINLTCAAGTETSPAGGYSISFTAATTATNTVTITGTGVTITAPSPAGTVGNLNDAIFKILGSDYITLQGFTMLENAANTTTAAGTNNMVEWGVALLYATTTNGAQNITIRNNTITLNRTYQNTFGIYSNSTHNATSITGAATATTTAGSNSGMKVYGNTISNVNQGIVVVGPTAAADQNTGIDIGGTGGAQANTISNYGTTGTFSGYLNVSGTVNGILLRNSYGFNISYNTITSSVGGTTAGTLNGIQIPAATAAPTATFTNTINNNNISLQSAVTAGAIVGISYPSGSASATSTANINNNNFATFGHTVAASGTITFITIASTNQFATISNNTFTNMTVNTTGSVTFISHNYSIPTGGTQTINNNSIVTAFNKTGSGGTVTCTTTGASSPNGPTSSTTNNNFSNITVTGTTAIQGTLSNDGSGTSPAKIFTGNTYSNWTGGTGSITGVTYNYIGATTSSISNNTFSNITGQGAISAIVIGNTFAGATTLNVANNTISNLISTGAGGAVLGISCSNASTTVNMNNNAVSTLASTGATAVTGISISGATNTNVFKNRICDISGSNASSTVNGILVSAGTTISLSNNRIGDLRTPAANAANPLVGINITGGTTVNAYFNSVYLNGSSTGALFGSSAISASTTPTITLNNNIFFNTSGIAGAGLAVAYRRSSTTLTTYAATSDRNDLFATIIYTDGTNTDATLAAYKTRVAARDANSISVTVPFLSTTCGNANFLKIDPAIATQIESGGANIAGITDDFENDIRQGNGGYAGTGTAPDIGADEVNGTPAAVCSGTPASSTIGGAAAVCTGLGTTLNLSNPYTDLGYTFQWAFSTTAGGPYTNLGTSTTQATGALTVTTYYVCTITCTNSGLSYTTLEKTVTVNALPLVAVSPTTGSLCQPGATPITLTASGASTYAWSPAAGLSATTGTSVTANPTANTTYTVTGTDVNGCINTATSVISIFAKPSAITVTPASPVICAGATQLLTATGGTNTGLGATIGSGTAFTSATGEQTAFCNRRLNYVGQTIYTAAELTAAGIPAGNITSLSYNISSNGDATTNAAFTVKIGHEGSLVNFPSTAFLSNATYTTVYGPATYTHASPGWQVITFTTPFVWDGVSNICIDVRHNGIDAINNAQTQFTTTAGNASIFGFNTPATGTLSTTRLNIQLGFAAPANAFTWAPITDLYTDALATIAYTGTSTNNVYAKLTATQTYTVTSTNPAGCTSSAPVTVTVSPGAAISAQPIAVTSCEGSNAYFKVTATGPGLTYQWFKDGNPLSNGGTIGGVTTDSLFINGIVVANAGVYTVQVSSSCGSPVTSNGVSTLTVNPKPSVPVSPSGSISICAPASQLLNASGTNAASPTYQWLNNNVVIGAATSATYTVTATGSYRVRVQNGVTGCFDTSVAVVVTVNPQPTAPTVTPAAPTVCLANVLQLTASGSTATANILSEDFNAPTNGWTTINNSTGGTPALAAWTLRPNGYTYPTTPATFNSNDNSQFYLSNSDEQGSGGITATILRSPAFSTIGFSSINLSYYHYYRFFSAPDSGTVEISTDGTTWNFLQSTKTTTGTPTGFVNSTLSLNGYLGQPTVYIRFRYAATFDYFWAIDNVLVSGSQNTTYTWSPSSGLFTDGAATAAYTGTQTPTVYAKPTATNTYTVTSTSVAGCPNTATVTVTVTPPTSPNGLAGTPTAGATTQWTETHVIATGQNYVEAATCDLISTVIPFGGSPVSGSVMSAVRVDTGATKMGSGELYAARFYAIEPATAPATSTARITLYYLQSEFDNYNAKATDSAKYLLPTGPADALGISRLVIRQFHGTPTGGYLPGNYAGANEVLDPADADVIWNATANRWEITVPVSSFSGFWLTSVDFVVPVRFTDLYAKATGNTNTVYWTTAQENNNRKFVVEKSVDGRSFTTIGEVATQALNGNSSTPISYNFVDGLPFEGKSYYKLRQVDRNGAELVTPVVTVLRGKGKFEIVDVRPNPTTGAINFNVIGSNTAITVVVRTLSGQQVMRSSLSQSNSFSLNLGGLSNGMYLLEATDRNGEKATFKIVKQ